MGTDEQLGIATFRWCAHGLRDLPVEWQVIIIIYEAVMVLTYHFSDIGRWLIDSCP